MNAICRQIKNHGLKTAAASLALCLLADVVRAWLWLLGQHGLAAELLAEERKMWN